jgi:hypothetical protein
MSRLALAAATLAALTGCGGHRPPLSVPTTVPAGSALHARFEGVTPCSGVATPLPQIPAGTRCEQAIWQLDLFQEASSGAPTTYALHGAYGVPRQGTPGLAAGSKAITMQGRWSVVSGTRPDPQAVVYRLDGDAGASVSFVMLSPHLLHLLASDGTPRVGNASWSYTLNRTDRPAPPSVPRGSSLRGVYEGRTPCHAITLRFTETTPYPDCRRIKWRLSLYRDRATGAPTSYHYQGTYTVHQGTWQVVRGAPGRPAADVYRLQPDGGRPPISFLKVGADHLFVLDEQLEPLAGNALFSYTLSRTDESTP